MKMKKVKNYLIIAITLILTSLITSNVFNFFISFKEVSAIEVDVTYESGDVFNLVGAIEGYSSNTIPAGYLLCSGQAVSRTTYSTLFNAIGTTFGSGNGSTTFNLPNLNSDLIVGQDTGDSSFNDINKKGGNKTETLTISQIPSHTHTFTGGTATTTTTGSTHKHNIGGGALSWPISGSGIGAAFSGWRDPTIYGYYITYTNTTSSANSEHTHTVTPAGSNSSTGSGGAHNNLGPYITINYIIKF